MKKIMVAALISCGLFVIGWYSLIAIRENSKPKKPHIVIDYDPECNETTYLDIGSSEAYLTRENPNDDIITEAQLADTLLGPNEDFHTLSDGQTLHSILRPNKVSEHEIAKLSTALHPFLRARDLAAGDLYRFKLVAADPQNNLVDHLVIRKLDPNRIPIIYRAYRTGLDPRETKFTVLVKEPAITDELALIELTVGNTLYQTFSQIPFGTELMQRLMGVFAWQMRMPEDVLPGDHIEMLVIKRYIQGEFIGFGKIESAYYRQKIRSLFGIYFSSEDQKIQGFFDEHGKSLEREFAYSPVYETIATSNQKWRLHPVRKIRMRHNGIDYRGAIGTEFYSIADGEVIEKRYDVNVGNMIRVQHKYGVISEYFHADTLADNIDLGHRIKRGQLLGTIGRTGRLCTGPHLHMGLYKMQGDQKRFIELSSLRNILKSAPNISAPYLAEFTLHRKNLLAKMQDANKPSLASSGN